MSELLDDLCNGNFKLLKRESGKNLILESYKTDSGSNVQLEDHIYGKSVYVNGIEQSRFYSWLVIRAIRKGARNG